MTSQHTRRAARRRRLVILPAGFALAAALAWPAAIDAQPAPKAAAAAQPAKPAAPAATPSASKPAAGAERPQRKTDAATARDYVVVKSYLDRSAIWIAERFAFIIEVECTHGTDILTDDLSRDRLQMDEVEILGVEQKRDDRGEGRTSYRFTYHLTTYSFEPPAKNIREMRLRYYVRRPGQRPEDVSAEGEIVVPGAQVYVRSLLPDDANFTKYRNERPTMARGAFFVNAGRIGLGLVIVSIVPAAFLVVAIQRRWRHRRRHLSARKLRHDERASLDDVRALEVGTEEGRKQVFDRLCALVRTHVSGAWDVNADGLSVAEITAALSDAGKADVSADVTSFLDTCEKARYGKAEDLPSREACLAAIDRAEQLIGLGRA
jgi:hypothetical protein